MFGFINVHYMIRNKELVIFGKKKSKNMTKMAIIVVDMISFSGTTKPTAFFPSFVYSFREQRQKKKEGFVSFSVC